VQADPVGPLRSGKALACRFRQSELVHARWAMLGVAGAADAPPAPPLRGWAAPAPLQQRVCAAQLANGKAW